MNPFSKSEIISLFVIFLILIAISIPNFVVSLRRARDQVRKDDLGGLVPALGLYHEDFGIFPLSSSDGRIVACKKSGNLVVNYIPCNWGVDAFDAYMPLLPRDPDYQKGAGYRYISDGSRFQIYVSLENNDDPEYDPKIIARNLMCGNLICNAGRGYGRTPTNISLEEYEAQLLPKK